jgi:hypothetical protein
MLEPAVPSNEDFVLVENMGNDGANSSSTPPAVEPSSSEGKPKTKPQQAMPHRSNVEGKPKSVAVKSPGTKSSSGPPTPLVKKVRRLSWNLQYSYGYPYTFIDN